VTWFVLIGQEKLKQLSSNVYRIVFSWILNANLLGGLTNQNFFAIVRTIFASFSFVFKQFCQPSKILFLFCHIYNFSDLNFASYCINKSNEFCVPVLSFFVYKTFQI